jgi:hypothetical protein
VHIEVAARDPDQQRVSHFKEQNGTESNNRIPSQTSSKKNDT